jgi:acetate kinase
MARLKECLPLAPIHNPNSYSVIEVCADLLPGVPQYAVFDTAFHTGMPEEAKRYAIPRELAEKFGFHKVGFHGLSYQYVSARTAELLGKSLHELKLILCHLGTGGSSVVAVKDGKSLDSSMGYSPLAGLVMSTRSGDIDPACERFKHYSHRGLFSRSSYRWHITLPGISAAGRRRRSRRKT